MFEWRRRDLNPGPSCRHVPDTTIPVCWTVVVHIDGSMCAQVHSGLSFQPVSGLARRQWSFQLSFAASVAGLQ